MTVNCQNADCDHEFDDAVSWGPVDARNAGETPYLVHVYEATDGVGVYQDYYCSHRCLNADLDVPDGETA